jgi:predicted phage baseplate assembly protein
MTSVPPGEAPGACAPPPARTPLPVANPPGLARLDARVGTHGAFLATMLADLGGQPALARLGTRAPDDPTIAVVDAAAAILDVLAFYDERIANEGYLATATERRSVLELARAVGYELNPGVAASTWLAFTLETASGSPATVTLPAGTAVQSIPEQGGQPQVFETAAAVEARPEWNAIPARPTVAGSPRAGDTELVVAGEATGLARGDLVVLVAEGEDGRRFNARKVVAVAPVPADPLGAGPPAHTVVTVDRSLTGAVRAAGPGGAVLHALRARAALFGHNAIAWPDLPLPLRVGELHPDTGALLPGPYASRANSWADAKLPAGTTTIWLDQVNDAITPGSLLLLTTATATGLFDVVDAVDEVHGDYLLSGPTTRLTVAGERIHRFSPKTTVVWGRSEALPLADPPRTEPIAGDRVPLAVTVTGIEPGRLVAVGGTDAATGEAAAEVRAVRAVNTGARGSTLVLDRALDRAYAPASVRVNANVAPATRGETRGELLGGGDARRPWLRLRLSGAPLTYVPAPTPSGGRGTLTVRVGGVAWTEVADLYGQPDGAPVYTVRHDDAGTATVEFGPRSRPPTGTANITASYRTGIGVAGNVAAGAAQVPLSRPLGLRSVTNPTAATGGADPERLDDARANAPCTVRSIGRIVSLRDYEDFARAYAGIAKARADTVWSGQRRAVHLTVAGDGGAPLGPDSATIVNLRAAVDAARHPDHTVRVADYDPVTFDLGAGLQLDPALPAADVLAAASAAVLDAFSFARRGFGQPVLVSEVLAVLHGVPGVTGVVLDRLRSTRGAAGADPVDVPARRAGWSAGAVLPAQLVTADPAGVALRELP